MSFISIIVIYHDNGAENSCISSIFGFSPRLYTCSCVCFFAMLDQMDRSWVHGRLFSHVHIQGKFSEMSKYCAHVVDVLIKNTLVLLL
jgi:hypothetical protein